MTDKPTLIEFPCHFPIKVIGVNSVEFKAEITEIVTRHFPETQDSHITAKDSQEGRYLSLTVTVYALDKPSLDALYEALTKHPSTRMVL